MPIGSKHKMYAALAITLFVVCSCGKPAANQAGGQVTPQFNSYQDIPGVTQDEIKAIENLQKQTGRLVYGATPSTEAFITEDGEIGGFIALFSDWLSALFGIRFQPEILDWGDILAGLKNGDVDFCNLMATDERIKTYFFTDRIAEHSLKTMRIEDTSPLDRIALTRPVRYVLLEESATIGVVAGALTSGTYEVILSRDYDSAYQLIKNGDADAFIEYGMAEAAFDAYGDVVVEDFFPLIFGPVSMTAGNREFVPIISIVTKALRNGGIQYVNRLYKTGQENYTRNQFLKSLDAEEREYLLNTSVVPVLAAPWFYPLVFYNKYEKAWQGIGFDVLDEVTKITGLVFEMANASDESWAEIYQKLNDGKAPICLDLIRNPERSSRYLWSKYIYMSENYALISKHDLPNISIGEIQYAKIGLIKSTAWADMFQNWFPAAANITMYDSQDGAFLAMDRGEIDLVMAGTNALSSITFYYEFSNYKANYIFNSTIDYVIAYNKSEDVLCSVIDKALAHVDLDIISKQWENKTFDYQSKLILAQRPWLIGAVILSLGALVLILVFFQRSRMNGRRLKSAVEQFEITWNNAESGIAIIDAETRIITDINPAVARMYGGSREEVVGRHCETIFCGDKGCPVMDNNQTINQSEHQLKNAAGEIIPIVKSVSKINYNGHPALLESFSDISYIKKAEEAQNASRAKGNFLSHMSHEIRTPLNAIIGMISIAESTNDFKKIKYCLERADSASRNLLGIVNDILDMSKIEANKFELAYSEFNFEKMLMGIVNITNVRAEEKHLNFVVDLNANVPPIIITDELRLSQVITNLLTNAIKFTPENGKVVLKIEKIDEQGDNITGDEITLKLEISDTGIGITEKQKERLFTSYVQAESDITQKFGGTGLGLAISKQIVELMQGNIWIESELNKGSKFIFTIKAKKVSGVTAAKLSAKINIKEVRTLAVDDSEETRAYFSHIMETFHMPCDVASSGAEALEMIKNSADKPYNIFFVDWQLPEMDGIELTKLIKEITGDKSFIIMLSMTDWSNIEKEAISAGVNQFIPKPLFPSAMINAINECIEISPEKDSTLSGKYDESSFDFSGFSILVAEDVEINREIVAALLENSRISIDFAENGKVAVSMFSENPDKYSLIFMDVNMPEMDGYEATRRIRSVEAELQMNSGVIKDEKNEGAGFAEGETQNYIHKRITIIAMTANVFREDIEKCISAGMDDHIGKPIDYEMLREKLKKYLRSDSFV